VQTVLGLVKGPGGNAEELHEFFRVIPTESFGRIPAGGSGGLADLLAEFDITISRVLGSKRPRLTFQFACELPGNEIFESTCTHANGQAELPPEPENLRT